MRVAGAQVRVDLREIAGSETMQIVVTAHPDENTGATAAKLIRIEAGMF